MQLKPVFPRSGM